MHVGSTRSLAWASWVSRTQWPLVLAPLIQTNRLGSTFPRSMARPLVVCGPSGSGKSTMLKRLMSEFPDNFGFSISHTTRSPRAGEQDGVHYHYVQVEAMRQAILGGEFIETAEFSGNMYGTSQRAVENVLEKGRICILDIDMQGVQQIKKMPSLDPFYVFVQAPSLEVLEGRLRARGTENEDSLAKRLMAARKEMEFGRVAGNFDLVILNDDLPKAYQELKNFVVEKFNFT